MTYARLEKPPEIGMDASRVPVGREEFLSSLRRPGSETRLVATSSTGADLVIDASRGGRAYLAAQREDGWLCFDYDPRGLVLSMGSFLRGSFASVTFHRTQMIQFRPINNYLSLKVVERPGEEILMPDDALPEVRWAHVLETGPGVPDMQGGTTRSLLNKGDLVCVMAHGRELVRLSRLGGEDCFVASELDVMCIGTLEDNTVKLKPLGVLVEIAKVEDPRPESGVLMPDSKVAPPTVGIVRSVGKGYADFNGNPIEHQVQVGQKVIFDPYKAMVVDCKPIGVAEKRYLVMHGDIWGVLE